jgi:F0F1-type ATP synthase membrane subunit b/b'
MTLQLPFYVQVPLFVALWMILHRLWFAPALKVIHERAKRSEGAIAETRSVQAEAERLRNEHAAAPGRRHNARSKRCSGRPRSSSGV